MFEVLLSNGLILKKIVESIKELVTEVNFEISSEAISMQAMDASHVALVVLVLRASEFEEYRCDRPQTLGVSISNLAKLLKIAGNDDSIILRADDLANVLTLVFSGKNNEKMCEFNLNLITLDSEHLGIPDQDYAAEVKMSSSEFARICRELTQVTDTLNLSVDKEKVKFAVSGDIGAGSITMHSNISDRAEELLSLSVGENVSMSFALRYLNLFNKASALSDEVQLSLYPEVPIVVKFSFSLGELKFFLAPKISDDI